MTASERNCVPTSSFFYFGTSYLDVSSIYEEDMRKLKILDEKVSKMKQDIETIRVAKVRPYHKIYCCSRMLDFRLIMYFFFFTYDDHS